MCESIYRGNINQIGRNAWVSMIDNARELVMDHINDLKADSTDPHSPNHPHNADQLQKLINNKQNQRNAYIRSKGGRNAISEDDEGYNNLLSERNDLMLSYNTKFNKYTYPQLYNNTVPSEIYSITVVYGPVTFGTKSRNCEI